MRILYAVNSLSVGGAERLTAALAGRMAQRGHETAVVTLRARGPAELGCEAPVVSLEMRREPWSVLRGLARGRRLVAEFRPDVVHSHSFHANLVARLLGALPPRPAVISTVHNVYEGGWRRMAAYRLTDGLSAGTVAVCKAAAQRFVRLGAVPAGKCRAIANAIEVERFSPNAARRARVRAAMGAAEEFVWLAVGRDAPAKDYPTLIEAFTRVRAVRPGAELWIAGADAPDRGPAGGGRWLGLRDDVAALMDGADGFVMSSAWEGMPLAAGEAMAMEKPVVATDVGGVRELVGDAGLLAQARDPGRLAEAMRTVMNRPEAERAEMGRRARTRIVERFGIEAWVAAWERLYEEVAARGPTVE